MLYLRVKYAAMQSLREYLNSLPVGEQESFADACGTSIGYLRKAISIDQRLSEALAISIERESGQRVTCEDLRPDVDWAYLRTRRPPRGKARAAE